MLSYGGVALQVPSAEEGAWIEAQIPIRDAFGFMRPKVFDDPAFNPRTLFNWYLNRPFKLNCFVHPWSASRFGYAFVLADGNMHDAIAKLNPVGTALPFVMDDGVGNSKTTDLYQLPAISLSNIRAASPALPLYLLPLVDQRQRFWEVVPSAVSFTPYAAYPAPYPQQGTSVDVVEGTTTWADLYAAIAAALTITLTVDPVSSAFLFPGNGFTKQFQYLPLLLDWVASSCGQRIVRNLDGTFNAYSASTAQAIMIAQATPFLRKYAGASLDLGVVSA